MAAAVCMAGMQRKQPLASKRTSRDAARATAATPTAAAETCTKTQPASDKAHLWSVPLPPPSAPRSPPLPAPRWLIERREAGRHGKGCLARSMQSPVTEKMVGDGEGQDARKGKVGH